MISIRQLDKKYYGKGVQTAVLDQLSLEIGQGEFVCILGKSGCGKTTLLNILGLLDYATGGEYELDGVNVMNLSRKQLAKYRNQKFGFIFPAKFRFSKSSKALFSRSFFPIPA